MKPYDKVGGLPAANGCRGVSSAEFAKFVSNQLRAPVMDNTGLSGKFNFSFKTTNATELSLPGDSPEEGPSIFTSLSEQLGLKLVSRRVPIDFLFIDYARKPRDQP